MTTTDKYQETFMINLKSLLKASGLIQKEFAAEIGVSRETVNNWLNDKCFPHPLHVCMIAKFFQTDPLEMGREVITSRTAA